MQSGVGEEEFASEVINTDKIVGDQEAFGGVFF